ncbi:hypothetical protein [Chroococcidiopsis sp.]
MTKVTLVIDTLEQIGYIKEVKQTLTGNDYGKLQNFNNPSIL